MLTLEEIGVSQKNGQAIHLGASPMLLMVIERLGIEELINAHCPSGQQKVSNGKAALAIVLSRLLNPKALYKIEDWLRESGLETLLVSEAEQLNDDLLRRMLDVVYEKSEALWVDLIGRAFQGKCSGSRSGFQFQPEHLLLLNPTAGETHSLVQGITENEYKDTRYDTWGRWTLYTSSDGQRVGIKYVVDWAGTEGGSPDPGGSGAFLASWDGREQYVLYRGTPYGSSAILWSPDSSAGVVVGPDDTGDIKQVIAFRADGHSIKVLGSVEDSSADSVPVTWTKCDGQYNRIRHPKNEGFRLKRVGNTIPTGFFSTSCTMFGVPPAW